MAREERAQPGPDDRFRGMIEASPDWFWETDPEGRYTYASPRVEGLLGYTPDELIGRTCFDLMPTAEAERLRPLFEETVAERRSFQALVNLNLHRDGREVVLETSGVPILGPDGALLGYRGIDRDITGRTRAIEALRDSEATLRSLLEATPVAVGLVSSRILGWSNERMHELSGFTGDELMGQSARILYPSEEEYLRVGRIKDPLVEKHGVGSLETQFRRKDGRVVDVLLRSAAIDRKDLSRGLVFTALDISERKRAEEETARTQALLLAALEASPAGILIADAPDVRIRFANRAALGIRGESAEPLVDIPVELHPKNWQVSHPDGRAYEPEELPLSRAVMRGEKVENVEVRIRRPDGEHRWVLANAAPVLDAAGETVAGVVVFPDITDLKQAERMLRMARQAVDHASDAVFWMQEDARFVYVNDAACQSLGYTREELLEMSVQDIDPDFPSEAWPEHWEDLRRRGTLLLESHHRRKDGSVFPVEITANHLRFEDGEYNFSFVRDLTERRSLEAQLRQAQKMEAIGQLAGGVAHDFNNQLTVIGGYSDLLLQRLDAGDPIRLPLEEIKRSGDRAKQLTSQLLAFSRKQVLKPKVLDLAVVLGEMADPLRRMVEEQIHLTIRGEAGDARARVDRAQFEQAVINLVVNARDAMRGGGEIAIRSSIVNIDDGFTRRTVGANSGRHAMVTVRDTGHGMDSHVLQHIFDPFFTTKGVDEGTGLGLSMVYGFVKQSGGFITVDSVPEDGTTFRIYFPVAEEPVGADARRDPEHAAGGTETILVVEDESSVRHLIVEVLRKAGYEVLEAEDARRALEICGESGEGIDLLVTDVVMPIMNGPELADRILADRPAMRVLFVSGYAEQWAQRFGGLSPKGRLLQKPFSTVTLRETVRQTLDRGT